MAEAHVRIDEGIKRGPRKKTPPKPPESSQRAYTVALRPLHNLTPEERQKIANAVLDRYINGEQVSAIAPEYGVSDVTIYALLLREHESAWKDIQTARALARLESQQEQLNAANDALSLARAREGVRSAQWELERLLHRLYGQKQEVKIDATITVQVEAALTSEANELLSHIRSAVAQTPAKALAAPLSPEKVINPTSSEDK